MPAERACAWMVTTCVVRDGNANVDGDKEKKLPVVVSVTGTEVAPKFVNENRSVPVACPVGCSIPAGRLVTRTCPHSGKEARRANAPTAISRRRLLLHMFGCGRSISDVEQHRISGR